MEGKADQLKGKVKQAVGDLTGDKDLRREGKIDEITGKTKDFIDDMTDKAKDLVDKAKDKLAPNR